MRPAPRRTRPRSSARLVEQPLEHPVIDLGDRQPDPRIPDIDRVVRLGVGAVAPEVLAAAEQREFRTPSLRNLRHTAPYMHDGSLQTLEDVFVFYDQLAETVCETLDGGDAAAHLPLDPLLRPLNLNPDDFPALKAFLDALSSDTYDKTIPIVVPSGLPIIQ